MPWHRRTRARAAPRTADDQSRANPAGLPEQVVGVPPPLLPVGDALVGRSGSAGEEGVPEHADARGDRISRQGIASHSRIDAFCERDACEPRWERGFRRCSTTASGTPSFATTSTRPQASTVERVDVLPHHDQPSGTAPAVAAAANRRRSPTECQRALQACRFRRRRAATQKSRRRRLQAAAEGQPREPRDDSALETVRAPSRGRRSLVIEGSTDVLVETRHLLDVSAAPIMFFSLCPARITAPDLLVASEYWSPWRTPSVTAEERMFSEPALQDREANNSSARRGRCRHAGRRFPC